VVDLYHIVLTIPLWSVYLINWPIRGKTKPSKRQTTECRQ